MKYLRTSLKLQNDGLNNLINFSSPSNHVILHQFQHTVDRDFPNCWLVLLLHPQRKIIQSRRERGGKTEVFEYCKFKCRKERVEGRNLYLYLFISKEKRKIYENSRKRRQLSPLSPFRIEMSGCRLRDNSKYKQWEGQS